MTTYKNMLNTYRLKIDEHIEDPNVDERITDAELAVFGRLFELVHELKELPY